jgi:hypothetical protein
MCQLRSKLFLGLGLHFFCCAYYNGFKPAKATDARLLTYPGMSSRYIWWKAWTPLSCFTL